MFCTFIDSFTLTVFTAVSNTGQHTSTHTLTVGQTDRQTDSTQARTHLQTERLLITSHFVYISILTVGLWQVSQTRGPRAACGPRNYFVWPAALSTNLKIFRIKTTYIIHFTRKNIIHLRPLLTYIYCAFPLTRE